MVVQLFFCFLQSQPDACGLTQMLPFSEQDGLADAASLRPGSRPDNSLSSAVSLIILLFLLPFFRHLSPSLRSGWTSVIKSDDSSLLTQPALTSGVRRHAEGAHTRTGRRNTDEVLARVFESPLGNKVAESDETKSKRG